MGQPPGCLTNVGHVSLCFKLPGVVSVWCDSITFLLPLHPADNHFHGNKAHSSCDEVFSGIKLWANTPKIQISDLSKPKLSQWYSNGTTNQSSHAAASCHTIRTSVLLGLMLGLSLGRRQVDVSPWPEVAQVADRKAQRETHLGGHDDERHVPSQHCHDKDERTTGLVHN